ncbi:armadillo-type protein [Aspergillus aurantiobrunneus]
MSSKNDGVAIQHPSHETLDNQARNIEGLHCPSLAEILPESQLPPATESPRATTLPPPEQEALLRSVEVALKEADLGNATAALEDVPSNLLKLWHCQSQHLLSATEALANGSRNLSLRLGYGQSGILGFMLRLIASREVIESSLIHHCLRLIGNSCADTDENRATVVKENYTFAILRHLLRPELIHVVIPVIYNLCIDFEPAQSQLAANKIVYILLKLLKDDAFQESNGLLDYVYELIELAAEQEQGIESSPEGTILLLVATALDREDGITPSQFFCLTNCIVAYLNHSRFQDTCISRRMVPDILSVLKQSLSFNSASSSDDAQALVQSQLKINQALAELSASPLFAELYPLASPLSQTLKSWLNIPEDQLQICACIMLGNLARSDEVCVAMINELKIHEELIAILNSNARGVVLHSALGFLKNLAVSSKNRLSIGEAGIMSAIARLWGYDSVPQVQLAAISITRQLVISSVENIHRLLEPAITHPGEGESGNDNDDKQSYLTLLLALFQKTDSIPIKTEIGRITASLCRTLIPKFKANEKDDSSADSLLDCLFTCHKGIALPLGTMVMQTQWPVVRSEGWFALALMASNKPGSEAVVYVLQQIDGFPLIEQTLKAEEPTSDNEADKVQWHKDRDNIVVLVQELLKNEPNAVDASWNSTMQDLIIRHVSKYL